MFTPDLASFELRECADLPKNTLMAPLPFIREIRCLLGNIGIKMIVGTDDTVLLSSDVFAAFSSWDAEQAEPEELDSDQDNHWMN